MRKWLAILLVLSTMGLLASTEPKAADYPTKPVRLIVPYPAGGSADILARMVAQKLASRMGQPFIVENIVGATGSVGAAAAARAAPDGYTLVIVSHGTQIGFAGLHPNIPWRALKDFTYIAFFGGPPLVLVGGSDISARSLAEFVQLAKSRPDQVTYAVTGTGSTVHLVAEQFQQRADVRLLRIPYPGGSEVAVALLSKQVMSGFTTLSTIAEHIKAGAVRPLAISTRQRSPSLPDVPTFTEQGFSEIIATSWFGLAGPANMPTAIVQKLNEEVRLALAEPDVRARLELDAIVADPLTPDEFSEFVRSEVERWSPIIKAANINAN